jgi:hypothetical protein
MRATPSAEETRRRLPRAEAVVTGDLASLQQMSSVAEQVNALGGSTPSFTMQRSATANRVETDDGFVHLFAINSLASYVLTALIHTPRRLIYISSEIHKQGDPGLRDLSWAQRPGKENRRIQTRSYIRPLGICDGPPLA